MRAILMQELALAVRSGSGVGLGLSFFLTIVMITAIGIGREPELLAATAPGAIWVAALLAGLLSLDRMFQADLEDGSLEVLMLSPHPFAAVVAMKIIAHWLTSGLPLVILSPVMALMLNLPVAGYGWMLISLAVGTLSLSALGAIGAALTVGIRRGGLLLSLLVMPLFVPSLIFGTRCVVAAARAEDPTTAFILLSGITLFSLSIAPLAAAAAIRINLR